MIDTQKKKPPTQAQIKKARLAAWKIAQKACIQLSKYAAMAEDYEEPQMSDDAQDAAYTAQMIMKASHRFPFNV